jgi:hypothetical protein
LHLIFKKYYLVHTKHFFHVTETSADADPLVTLLQKENKQLKEEIATLHKQLAGHQQHATQKFPEVKQFGFEHIKLQSKRDVYTRHYTSVPTFEVLQWLCDMLASKMPESGASLSAVDRVLLVLMKLKLSATNSELSIRFGVSEQTVSVIIRTHIDVIAAAVGFLVPWPDREAIVMHMPPQCKKNFPKLRIIIDCTEVFIERSKNLLARAQTYSNYKHHNTIKFLVGISPSGAFTYISKAWGGRASDKQITLADGLLDKLDHGDMVMADRGFLIEEELAVRGVTLAIPAFTKGKKQFSRKDVEKSRQMSRFRIHVERAIRRLKVYKIMSTRMPISLLRYANSIAVICAALCNLRRKLF